MAADVNGELIPRVRSLPEVGIQLVYLEKLINERDRLYKERWDAQNVAIFKAEEAQKTYNVGHNDLTRKMETQYSTMVPQAEAKVKWDSIDKAIEENRRTVSDESTERRAEINGLRIELMKEIGSLRESRSQGEGVTQTRGSDRLNLNNNMGTIMAFIALLIALYMASKGH